MSRLEKLQSEERQRLQEAFNRATQRIIEWRGRPSYQPDVWSGHRDGSTRMDVDSHGGFGGLDRRVWILFNHGDKALLLVEKGKRDNLTCVVDLGTFCFGVTRPDYPMQGNRTYVQSISPDDIHAQELTIDQLILATEALDGLYTPEHIRTFTE